MHQDREEGFNGPLRLRRTEMREWANQTHHQVTPEEWEALKRMDDSFMAGIRKDTPPADVPPPTNPNISKRELSMDLFDALFA